MLMKDIEFRRKMGVIKSAVGHSYIGEGGKKALGQAVKSILRAVAKSEGLQPGDYDVRYNPGGSAVKGDGILHCDDLYVDVSPGGAGPGVLVRNCQGRKDFKGGPNGWLPWESFLKAGSARELQDSIRRIAPRLSGVNPPALPSGAAITHNHKGVSCGEVNL